MLIDVYLIDLKEFEHNLKSKYDNENTDPITTHLYTHIYTHT